MPSFYLDCKGRPLADQNSYNAHDMLFTDDLPQEFADLFEINDGPLFDFLDYFDCEEIEDCLLLQHLSGVEEDWAHRLQALMNACVDSDFLWTFVRSD